MSIRSTRKFSGNEQRVAVAEKKPFPFTIQAEAKDISLAEYVAANRLLTEQYLTQYGAVLYRGFNVRDASAFSYAIAQLAPDILPYTEQSSPRSVVSGKVYTSTDHPKDQNIEMHSEQSYTLNWPQLICFFCQQKAESGGNTPIADNRRILAALPETLRRKFLDYGVMYQRVYIPGIGVDWQTAFQTEDRSQAEAFCEARNIAFTWENGNRLRTVQLRSAFQKHLATGDLVWFNHALFFHITSLEPKLSEALIDVVGLKNVPTNTFFGNGEPFTQDELSAMRSAVYSAKKSFDWENGDVLILDNMLSQHGREPFTGNRQILTLMARPYADYGSPILSP